MGKTSQGTLINNILLFSAFLLGFAFQGAYGQSTLSPGDIAFIGFNGDGDDDFAIVALKDISANTEIFFTDQDWSGSAFSGTGDTFSWSSGSSTIPAGTVITFNDISTGDRTVSKGSYSGGSAITLKVSNAVIFAYSGNTDNPSTFLASVATDIDQYDGSEGTLNGTELNQGDTAILLSADIDVSEYRGDRSGNTPNGYLKELNDNSNWVEENGGGDQSSEILPFDTTSFTVVDPPTIAFASSAISGEEGNTVNFTVELVEADNADVNVNVEFLSGPSTADDTDIDNYTTETLEFSGASTDDSQDVTISLSDSDGFEGTEKAVFQLKNETEGTIIEPSVLTLSIEDDDAPDIVINEIHADPFGSNTEDIKGDADGNGARDQNDDEFVEFINNQDTDIDVSGWKFFNEDDHKHTFPEGTVIPANGALVLFGDDEVSPQGNFGGAIIQSSNESASLSLVNGGDTISLEDENGNQVVSVNYSDANNDQSIVRDPEITGDFKNHSDVADGTDNLFSPGTEVEGTPFGSKHAIGIRGTEGWRMIASPVQDATFEDFFGDFWMQGVSGSDDTSPENGGGTLYSWDESGGGTFTAPANMSDNLEPGKGYIVYFFEDDDNNAPGIQGGFPKVINTDREENSGTVNVEVSATDDDNDGITGNEGWNLLGNPFDTDISAAAVIETLEDVDASVNTNISVWNHKSASWEVLDGKNTSDDTIAPFQAFFVHFDSEFGSEQVSFNKDDLKANKGTEFYKNSIQDNITFDFQLHGEQYYDTYSLEFSENGTTELDRHDAYKLFSLNSDAISLFSPQSNNRLQKNALPRELESNLEIPLSFDANGRSSLTFKWDDNMEDIPNEWDLILIDNEQNREIDLRRNKEYSFTINTNQQQESQAFSDKKGLLNKSSEGQGSRFILSVQPNVQGEISGNLPESVKLKPNYPNPFNPTTTIPYELAEDSDVLLTVWNMIGQKVATLVDGTVEAGTHEEMWNASDMPSGIYIARFEVDGTVFTRKMTLIK